MTFPMTSTLKLGPLILLVVLILHIVCLSLGGVHGVYRSLPDTLLDPLPIGNTCLFEYIYDSGCQDSVVLVLQNLISHLPA